MRNSIAIRSANGASYEVIREVNYAVESTIGRSDLPVEIREFTVAGTTTGSQIQVTEYEYALYNTGNPSKGIKWAKVIVEAEAATENGPGGTYESVTLYDEDGHEFWSKSGDGSLTYREFDPITGMVTKIVYNADVESPGGIPSDDLTENENFYGLSVGSWGRSNDGGSLIERSVYDIQGRIKEWTSPSGVKRYTRYEVAPLPSDPDGIAYRRTVSLPHQLGDESFIGPAVVAWKNAGGRGNYTSQWLITADIYEPLEDDGFDYDLEVARSTASYSLPGALESSRQWHDVAGNGYNETNYEYDSLGRITAVISPSGTTTYNTTYDIFDRALQVKVGTNSTNTVTVAEYFYDAAPGVAAQGIGDGNLTLSRAHVDASTVRDTQRRYDHRNRLTWLIPALPPYEYLEYDNLDRVVARSVFSDVPIDPPGTEEDDRYLYQRTYFSQRGLVYKELRAADPHDADDISSGRVLGTWTWYDAEARPIKSFVPNSPIVKRMYDGVGRVAAVYMTDGGGDGGISGSYSHALTVAGDAVIEQIKHQFTDYEHEWPGALLLTSTWRRLHDATETGELTAIGGTPSAVATYVGYSYDDAARLVRSVNFGTNAGTDEFSASAAPSWSPTSSVIPDYTSHPNTIVTGVSYDTHGRAFKSIDPEGRVTRMLFDDLGRQIAIIENYDDAIVAWNATDANWSVSNLDRAEPDTDRVTTYAYDSSGSVWKQTAHLPDPDPMAAATDVIVQVTEYVRDESVATSADGVIVSNDLLHEVRYPDESSGLPGSTDQYKVRYAYNRLGELVTLIDQNGTEHSYTRDAVGRATTDLVTAFGTNIDDSIKRIGTTYDDLGRVDRITSYTNTGGTQIRNEVMYTYDDLWRVDTIYQNPIDEVTLSGASPTGSTQRVRYTYVHEYAPLGGNNFDRLDAIWYPDKSSAADEETKLLVEYGDSDSIEDRISRPSELRVSNHNGDTVTSIVAYDWVGSGMAAIVNYPLVGAGVGDGVQLDRTLTYDPAGSLDVGARRFASRSTMTPKGSYPAWDRFGRTKAHAWIDGALDIHPTDADVPSRPPVVMETHTYDRASNPLTRLDGRTGAHLGNRDFAFAYDGLDRLLESRRGVATTPTWGQAGTQEWTLDMLGSWTEFRWDKNGDGDFLDASETDVRSHNGANEITGRTLENPSPAAGTSVPVTYDHAGNVRLRYETATTRLELTHDAWNRLVQVRRITGNIEDPPMDVARHEYNGLHWRVLSVEDTDTPRDGALDQRRAYFYSANWQVLEEWVEAVHDPDPYEEGLICDYRMQQFWGVRHIDDAVMLRRQEEVGEDAGDFTRVSFQLTDRQFSVVAVVDESGLLMERVTYDPYGRGQHRWPGDFNGDGYADSGDTGSMTLFTPIDDPAYKADEDLDRNGVIDIDDLVIAASVWWGRGPLGSGQVSDPDGPGNRVGYAGYRLEPSSALYHVRFRWYDTGLGRWAQRDPAGTIDGNSLYQYVQSGPVTYLDPSGLCKVLNMLGNATQSFVKACISQPNAQAGEYSGLTSTLGASSTLGGEMAMEHAIDGIKQEKRKIDNIIKTAHDKALRFNRARGARNAATKASRTAFRAGLAAGSEANFIRAAAAGTTSAVLGGIGVFAETYEASRAYEEGDTLGAISSGSAAVGGVVGMAVPPIGLFVAGGVVLREAIEASANAALANNYDSTKNGHCDYLAESIERLISRVSQECCK